MNASTSTSTQERWGLMAQVASDLLLTERPADLLNRLFQQLSQHLELEVYTYFSLDDESGDLLLESSSGVPANLEKEIARLSGGNTVCESAAAERRPVIIEDVQVSNDSRVHFVREMGLTAYVSQPLIAHGRVVGVLSFGTRRRRQFDADELALLRTLCNQIATAVDRQRLHEQLQSERAQFAAVLHEMPGACLVVEVPSGRVISANRFMAETLYSPLLPLSEPETRRRYKAVHHDGTPYAEDEYPLVWTIRTGEVLRNQEIEYVRDEGDPSAPQRLTLQATTGLIRNAHGRPVAAIVTFADITQRKHIEEELRAHREHLEQLVVERTTQLEQSNQQLRVSERMSALGTLSAGLGHDMGNLLLPIRARIDALMSSGLSPEAMEHVKAVRQCADYLQSLTNGLRQLALNPYESGAGGQETNLEQWWIGVEGLMKNSMPRGVKLAVRTAGESRPVVGKPFERVEQDSYAPPFAGLPPLAVAPHKLTQAILNLVKNAGDILHGQPNGKVEIEAFVEPATAHDGPAAGAKPFVHLSVIDNGPGMPEEVRARAFEPFFTTKTRRLSTGLGLSLVHGIISSVGGTVEVHSRLAKDGEAGGTRITLRIPVVAPDADPNDKDQIQAVISIHDLRKQALLTQLLQGMGIEVHLQTQAPVDNAALWVVDATPQALGEAVRFLESGEGRVVMANGAPVADFERAGVIFLGEHFRLSTVRDMIRTIAHKISEASDAGKANSSAVRGRQSARGGGRQDQARHARRV